MEERKVVGVDAASEQADRTVVSPKAHATVDSTCLEIDTSTALIRGAKVTVGAVALHEVTTDEPAVAVDVIVPELTVR